MLNSIQGTTPSMGMQFGQNRELSSAQKSTVQDILSDYDPENISEEDAQEIFAAFEEAGISPMKGLKEAIEEAGFDAEDLRTKAGMEGPPPPPQGPPPTEQTSSSIDIEALQTLQSILDGYDLSALTEEEQQSLTAQLLNAGLFQTGSTMDLSI